MPGNLEEREWRSWGVSPSCICTYYVIYASADYAKNATCMKYVPEPTGVQVTFSGDDVGRGPLARHGDGCSRLVTSHVVSRVVTLVTTPAADSDVTEMSCVTRPSLQVWLTFNGHGSACHVQHANTRVRRSSQSSVKCEQRIFKLCTTWNAQWQRYA